MRRDAVLVLDDFSGGLVTKPLGARKLELKHSPNCYNVYSSTFSYLKKRKGYTKVNSSSIGGTAAKGLASYVKSVTGIKYLVALVDGGLEYMDSTGSAVWDGTFHTITQDTTAPLSNDYLHSDVMNYQGVPYLLLTTESRDMIHRWSGSGNTTVITGGPRAGYLKTWKNHLWALNCEAETLVDDCETVWTANTNVSAALDTDDYKVGDNSVALTIADGFTTGIAAYYNVTEADLYACDTLRCWIKSSVACDAGDLTIGLSETADLGGTPQYVDVPALTINTWTYCAIDLSTTTANREARDATVAVGINVVTDKGAQVVRIDHITASYTEPDRLRWSDVEDFTEWYDGISGYTDIFTTNDVGGTGIEDLEGRLYIFKAGSIHRVTYLGGSPMIDVRKVKSNIGTLSPNTIVKAELPEYGEMMFFLGTDKQIYLFDGDNATPISDAIFEDNGVSDFALTNIDINYASKAFAINIPEEHWVIFFLPIDTNDDDAQTTINLAVVYDYFTKSWWGFTGMAFSGGIYTYNGKTGKQSYVLDKNYLYKFNDGTSDNTSAIAGYWQSKKILQSGEKGVDNSSYFKKPSHMEVELKAVGAYDISFSYRTDWNTSWTAFDTVTQSTNLKPFEFPLSNNQFDIKLYDSTKTTGFEVYNINFTSNVKGQGR